MRSLLVGLLLGFAAGWFVSRLTGEHQTTPGVALRGEGTTSTDAPHQPLLQGAQPARVVQADPPEAPDAGAVWRRVTDARRAGDADALRQALEDLGNVGTQEAHRHLVALIRDPSLPVLDDMGWEFYEWLKDSTVEGVAQSAQARFAMQRARGYDLLRAAHGWFALIGAHEGEVALHWAEAEGNSVNEEPWRELAIGLLATARPEALDLARRIAETDPRDPTRAPYGLGGIELRMLAFGTWARLEPTAAVPALVREIQDRLDEQTSTGTLRLGDALDLYAAVLPAASFPDAHAVVRLVADSPWGLSDAFFLMENLHARGMSLHGLEAVVERPIVLLEGVASRAGPGNPSEAAEVWNARRRILGMPWAQSERALDAVEASLEWETDVADREALRAMLLRVRAERDLGSRDDDPRGLGEAKGVR